jgi:hypothetical protein
MAYAILGTPKPAFFDSSGSPLASGTVTVYDAGTSNAKATYPTADDADVPQNGVTTAYTLDSRGEIATQLWGRNGEDYKVILKDSAGATIYTIDEIRLPEKPPSPLVTFTSTDATPSISGSRIFKTAGTTTITDFDDGAVGDVIHITTGSNEITIQDNAAIVLRDSADFLLRTGDTLTLCMFVDQVWTEIARSYGTGQTESAVATNVITEAENGRTFFLNAVGGFTSTLPAPVAGLNFKFIVATAPTTAYIITTNGGDNIIYGNLLDIVGELVAVVAQDTVNFVASTSLVGDTAEFISDGTSWFCKLRSGANGGITTAAT